MYLKTFRLDDEIVDPFISFFPYVFKQGLPCVIKEKRLTRSRGSVPPTYFGLSLQSVCFSFVSSHPSCHSESTTT